MLRESIIYLVQVKGKKKTTMKEIGKLWKYGPISLVHHPVLVNSLPANQSGVSESIGLNI